MNEDINVKSVKDWVCAKALDYVDDIKTESEYWTEQDERTAHREFMKTIKEFCEEQMR